MTEQAPPAAPDRSGDQRRAVPAVRAGRASRASQAADLRDRGDARARRGGSGTASCCILLITVGVFFFIGQWLNIDWGAATWPFYVIAPRLALMASASPSATDRG